MCDEFSALRIVVQVFPVIPISFRHIHEGCLAESVGAGADLQQCRFRSRHCVVAKDCFNDQLCDQEVAGTEPRMVTTT